jgi:DNA-directed RNA polymerase specialized sigma24 family protein
VLRDIEGGDPEDVARVLRVSRGALKVRAHRARKALRARLAALEIERPANPRRTLQEAS